MEKRWLLTTSPLKISAVGSFVTAHWCLSTSTSAIQILTRVSNPIRFVGNRHFSRSSQFVLPGSNEISKSTDLVRWLVLNFVYCWLCFCGLLWDRVKLVQWRSHTYTHTYKHHPSIHFQSPRLRFSVRVAGVGWIPAVRQWRQGGHLDETPAAYKPLYWYSDLEQCVAIPQILGSDAWIYSTLKLTLIGNFQSGCWQHVEC